MTRLAQPPATSALRVAEMEVQTQNGLISLEERTNALAAKEHDAAEREAAAVQR